MSSSDSKIVGFRLLSGEDVVGRVIGNSQTSVRIERPCVIIVRPNPNGTASAAIVPWMMFSDDKEVTINSDHLLYRYTPKQDLMNAWNAEFGSGLIVPQKLLLP